MFAFARKWTLTVRVLPILVAVLILKDFVHARGWEFLDLNPLFSSLLGATIFLLGFLLSGILSDYKESEKIPGDMAASLESIFDEAYIVYKAGKSEAAAGCLRYVARMGDSIIDWFYRKERTRNIFAGISGFNDQFFALEAQDQATFINRLKQEQTALRKAVTRTHTIRETEFVSSAYAIAEALAFFLIAGLLIVSIEPFYESMFFVGLVTFLVTYLLVLIKRLDDPFEFKDNSWGDDNVSLKPLNDLRERMREKLREIGLEEPAQGGQK